MLKKSIIHGVVFLSLFVLTGVTPIFSAQEEEWNSEPSYTKLRTIDIWTFNEYRYRLTEKYFALRDAFLTEGSIDKNIISDMALLAEKWYKYLPENLTNKNIYNNLLTEIKKGLKYPDNESNYNSIIKALETFIEETKIEAIKGTIEASPKTGNAPLTVTLRAKVTDPTGTKIPDFNYIWWIDNGGKREIIGRKISLNYVIKEEGKTTIFLDVISNHKNEGGYTDVLPFSSRTEIEVKEKVASMIIKVNGEDLRGRDEIKFNPDESGYGLIFDATSSTPTSGTKFISTKWNFGNGIKREYDGPPKIERVTYRTEGEFTVTLELKTNELKSVERKFKVLIHKPVASISVGSEEWFIGDKFTFKAKPAGNDKNLTYNWEIIDIENDKVLLKKDGSTVTQTFTQKGKFNVKLHVIESSWDEDLDSKIIYINSRSPVAEFSYKVPKQHRPNTIQLDGSRSSDPDFTDDGKLVFNWIIDGEKVNLDNANGNGSVGYYTFDSVGDHSVTLEVTDPDGISASRTQKINVKSVLAVDFTAYPRVIQREQFVRFVAESKEADFFEWEFGDGSKEGGKDEKISHVYKKSGIFDVKLTVRDAEGNFTTHTQKVYVGDSLSPYASFTVTKGVNEEPAFENNACWENAAYSVDRVQTIKFDAAESIDIDGDTAWLVYSWKIGNDKFSTAKSVTHKFDELGCFPVKLTVSSEKNGKTHTVMTYVKVKNLVPELGSMTMSMVDPNSDPVVVNVLANGAKDPDGVVQSYLWYYYTDIDSEPQDFRSTTKPSTTFVLPKITGNYFFVLVMKDNNEARVTSEEISESKYSLTLSGDNANTPLIDLSVSDNSISAGEDVIFTANVKNILSKDISKDSEYFWDFDGDGFYDKETKENTASFKFNKSGEFYAKVKVKHKGFSNVRNIPVNVANKLIADFDYISVGNKFIFVTKSTGKVENYIWDLGDGNRIEGKDTVEHTYTDKNNTHTVKLKITEGTKVKEIEKKVISNPKNILKSKKEWVVVFTSPEYSESKEIILENPEDKIHAYLGFSKGEIKKYAIDYDIDFDTDVNGGKDDDIDNAWTPSLANGSAVEIVLNKNKIQNVRFALLWEGDVLLDSFDIKITKNYITEESVSLDGITFDGVSEQEKALLEQLKTLVAAVPEQYRKEASTYVQRLQEEYADANEKAKVIIDFETFLDNEDIKNADEIIEVLEKILVFWESDTSEKWVAYAALKALIPEDITCSEANCREALLRKLDAIKVSTDIETNKKIGSEILALIANVSQMSSKEKLDFKAVLKTFVYGGISNIPADEKAEVESETETVGEEWSGVLWILMYVLYGIVGLFAVIIFGAVGFWLFYKLSGNSGETSFTDFIASKTNGTPSSSKKEDILSETTQIKNETKAVPVADPLAESTPKSADDNTVPDWLKWAEAVTKTETTQEVKKDVLTENITKVEEPKVQSSPADTVPDWLKPSQDNTVSTPEPKKEDILSDTTSSPEDLQVPDWLKGTDIDNKQPDIIPNPLDISAPVVTSPVESPLVDNIEEISTSAKKDDSINLNDVTKVEELQVPDWLKWALDEAPAPSIDPVTPAVDETNLADVIWTNEVTSDTSEKSKKKTEKKEKTKKTDTVEAKKEEKVETKKPAAKKTEKKDDTSAPAKSDELWQDGMQIPDWLKDANTWDDKK